MSEITQNSDAAFRELVRVLEDAVRAGVSSLELEYQDREWIVYFKAGNMGLGASRIPKELQQAVIKEIVARSRKGKGKIRVSLLGKDYIAVVEKYESFGEWVYTIILKEPKTVKGSKKKDRS